MWVKGELFDDFNAVELSALDRLDRETQPNLFDRLSWFKLLWAHNPPGLMPLIARARADNTDAWLFLALQEGRRATALGNWYTLAFRPIFTSDASEATKRSLLIALARRLSGGSSPITSIILSPVPDHDGSAALIRSAFRRAGWMTSATQQTVNWTVNVKGKDFATYWHERPGQVRSTHDRKLKKFPTTTEIYTKFDAKTWAEYEDIYAESWKTGEGSPACLKAIMQTEGEAGCLRIGIARHGDRAVAAQLWTVENGHAIVHKLAYREESADMSPGTILTAAMFRHVIDADHVDLVDYGTGDDRYKADWMDQRAPLYRLELHNPKTLNGLIGAARAFFSTLIRRRQDT
jgi:hypothetical protein